MTGLYFDSDCRHWVVTLGHEFPDGLRDEYEYIGGADTVSKAAVILLNALAEKMAEELLADAEECKAPGLKEAEERFYSAQANFERAESERRKAQTDFERARQIWGLLGMNEESGGER